MRIKIPALKNQTHRGEEVKRLLERLDGVRTVTFTPLTGSIVILFDSDRTAPQQIEACLNASGLFDPSRITSADEQLQAAVTHAGLRIGKVAIGWALSKTLEANGLSLLAALI
jgi:copper chaperone CopZ